MASVEQLWETNIGQFVRLKIEEINSERLCRYFDELQPQPNDNKVSLRLPQYMVDFYDELAKENSQKSSTEMRVALGAFMRAYKITHKAKRQ